MIEGFSESIAFGALDGNIRICSGGVSLVTPGRGFRVLGRTIEMAAVQV